MPSLNQLARLQELECRDEEITDEDRELFGPTIHFCPDYDYGIVYDGCPEYQWCQCESVYEPR